MLMGLPGFEHEVRAIFADELDGVGEISTDGLGSVFCESGEGPRVLLTGHMDEVAFRVQNITPDGFIKFVCLGGWWAHTLLAQRVVVGDAERAKNNRCNYIQTSSLSVGGRAVGRATYRCHVD